MVECSDRYWPLILTYAGGEITEEEGEAWMTFDRACSQRAAAEDTPFVFLVDTAGRVDISASLRKRISEHLNNRPAHDLRYRSAVHMVFRSTLIRGVVKALSWMSTNKSVDKIRPHDAIRTALAAAKEDLPDADIDWDAVAAWFEDLRE